MNLPYDPDPKHKEMRAIMEEKAENIARLKKANDLLEKQIVVAKKADKNLKRRKGEQGSSNSGWCLFMLIVLIGIAAVYFGGCA